MLSRDSLFAGAFALTLLVSRLTSNSLTPLLYDSLTPTTSPWLPISANASTFINLTSATDSWRTIDPIFCIASSMGFDVVVLGIAMSYTVFCCTGQITHRERTYPMKYFALVGIFQAVSAVMFQYSAPGERTAPYLQALLSYFPIPITFLLRWLVLGRRPTFRKGVCALVVCLAEMASLIPIVFSGLETDAQRREEGGATGAWRIIWPIIHVLNMVPHALSNITLEKTVKDVTTTETPDDVDEPTQRHAGTYGSGESALNVQIQRNVTESHGDFQHANEAAYNKEDDELPNADKTPQQERLNMTYTLFWSYLWTFLGTCSLFWADFIPKFGLVTEPSLFGKQMLFNVKCMFGAEPECGVYVVLLFWGRMASRTSSFISCALLLRYGEGANFYALVIAAVSPLNFMVWTLFDEQPPRWHPHASLSTWLSVAALVIMIPAIVLYQFGPPEKDTKKPGALTEERRPLIQDNQDR